MRRGHGARIGQAGLAERGPQDVVLRAVRWAEGVGHVPEALCDRVGNLAGQGEIASRRVREVLVHYGERLLACITEGRLAFDSQKVTTKASSLCSSGWWEFLAIHVRTFSSWAGHSADMNELNHQAWTYKHVAIVDALAFPCVFKVVV